MMHSDFTPLIQINQQKIRICQKEILNISQQIQINEQKAQEYLQQIASIQSPMQGNAIAFQANYSQKQTYLSLLEELHTQISHLKSDRHAKHQELQALNLELEKYQYLHQRQIQAQIQRIKQKQSKLLDEIASINFYKGNAK
ncbi:hypothetical protein BBW65_01760 [Helicobacter enhydrae]|uniref:Uncharacterized protein n=1 Tax=Helicobacter enhydrae TaxID=222136 RepID=A0A1B1U4A1_9HELI|nr:flagellar export protein FliJ [Helicobacter enhydrae]ANV97607.1 hypothetical protein BBW65_01760 [Helicobacter enhydrae]